MKPNSRQLSYSRLLRGVFQIDHGGPSTAIPLHLCPAAGRACTTLSSARVRGTASTIAPAPASQRFWELQQTRKVCSESVEAQEKSHVPAAPRLAPIRHLPPQCYGCGAFTQTSLPEVAGYFNPQRNAVKNYTGTQDKSDPRKKSKFSNENDIVQASLQNLGADKLAELGLDPSLFMGSSPQMERPGYSPGPEEPLCDRCHDLIHHHHGKSIYHPSIDSIRETIEQSPYKNNHVYHVLDAADFPMSLLPKIHELLDLAPMRGRNRRSKSGKFIAGKRTEMSFIITRSDLLAPKKEMVDRLMPYLTETLRQALPRDSRHIRLGNVRCVSAKRDWWTSELREDIWNRGGAGWMVGKVNVGKSSLFHAVFPKGRMDMEKPKHDISVKVDVQADHQAPGPADDGTSIVSELNMIDEDDELLPPAREETNYPRMPIVSSLPGTTASPIRIPFGGGKGELIDLPGVARGDLEQFVREEHRDSMVLKSRVTPEQFVLKDGKSLLIGGLVRITPRDPSLHFLSYNFTALEPHLTATTKAIEIQEQRSELKVENVAAPGVGEQIRHAGAFEIKHDVTKKRTGPLTSRSAVGLKVDSLPYRVLSLDILIQGCGWVEVTVQVRTKHLFERPRPKKQPRPKEQPEFLQELNLFDEQEETEETNKLDEPNWPIVDVYSPRGQFIGSRPPLNAWVYNKPKKDAASKRKRPRKAMSGVKKEEKKRRKTAERQAQSGW